MWDNPLLSINQKFHTKYIYISKTIFFKGIWDLTSCDKWGGLVLEEGSPKGNMGHLGHFSLRLSVDSQCGRGAEKLSRDSDTLASLGAKIWSAEREP